MDVAVEGIVLGVKKTGWKFWNLETLCCGNKIG